MLHPFFSRFAATTCVAAAAIAPLSLPAIAQASSPFAGTIAGTFGTAPGTNGTFQATISDAGAISGSAHENTLGLDATLTGTVSDAGALHLTGDVGIGTLSFDGTATPDAADASKADVSGTYSIQSPFGSRSGSANAVISIKHAPPVPTTHFVAGYVSYGTLLNGQTVFKAIPGVTISLLSGKKILASTTTLKTGSWKFSGVADGSYVVALSTPAQQSLVTFPALPVKVKGEDATVGFSGLLLGLGAKNAKGIGVPNVTLGVVGRTMGRTSVSISAKTARGGLASIVVGAGTYTVSAPGYVKQTVRLVNPGTSVVLVPVPAKDAPSGGES